MATKRSREDAFTSSTCRWSYDVYLSFRGEDTRKNFTDHLYTALKQGGLIYPFRDDDELKTGEDIGSGLLKAIEESMFSIVVFSRNYGTSTWCLDELVHIMKCKRTIGQTVVPIFYDVTPSEVRKQEGSFKEAFVGHQKRFKEEMEKVKRWRDALTEAANLKGEDLQNYRHESELIWVLVQLISGRLSQMKLSVAIHPVGLHYRAEEVIKLLYDASTDINIVGICGMGGIGKTSIAKEVYNLMFDKFEGSSFLADVREKYKSPHGRGIAHLQKQFLSDILMMKGLQKINHADQGLNLIETRLCQKRVLIVLDDVDELEQLNKILGNRKWLHSGSKVIITTRVNGLLNPSNVYREYEVAGLDDEESLQLFSFNAFENDHLVEDYMEYSKRVIRYAGGIPLALEVLGLTLHDRSIDVWKSTLEKLKVVPNGQIQDKLQISYDSLSDHFEKTIFLDIACFFIGVDKDYVMRILDGCGFFSIAGIDNLIRRGLVKVNSDNKLMMHDLLRDMGRQIVRQRHPQEPGKWSRVWHDEHSYDVLTNETGTEEVEGLILNTAISNELLRTKAFKKMKKLRLLQLNFAHLTKSYKHISKRLIWLCWRESPLESIPIDLHMGNLVVLDMRYSSLKQVWEEAKFLGKLKFLDLSHSHKLAKTPNFKGLPCLEIMKLKDCTSLVEIHDSICELRSLKNLIISGCSKLKELPEELGNIESLVELLADGIAIGRLPRSIENLKNLRSLSLRECQLTPSPTKALFMLPAFLKELDLRYCNLSDDVMPNNLQNLHQLEIMRLSGNNFSSLPTSISLLSKLHSLELNDCKRLQLVPELPSSLNESEFGASGCTSLERIDLAKFNWLFNGRLRGCGKLVEIKGYHKLEPVGAEIVERLKIHDLFKLESISSIRVHIINFRTQTSRLMPLQVVYDAGFYSIYLPGSEIPTWFNYQCEGDSVSYYVPPLKGREIVGYIISIVYAWGKPYESCIINPWIRVENITKKCDWTFGTYFSAFSSKVEEDILWLSYHRIQTEIDFRLHGRVESDSFGDRMEEGDQVQVRVQVGWGIEVKKCGAHLLFQQNDQKGSQPSDLAMIPFASPMHSKGVDYGYILQLWRRGITTIQRYPSRIEVQPAGIDEEIGCSLKFITKIYSSFEFVQECQRK